MRGLSDSGALLGRILLALIFLGAGTGKFANPARTAAYMRGGGIPDSVVLPLLYLAALVEVLGGILLIIGLRVRIVALILVLFLIPVTIIFHAIPHDQTNTLKNIAIMGGLLMVATQGPGRLSLDRG